MSDDKARALFNAVEQVAQFVSVMTGIKQQLIESEKPMASTIVHYPRKAQKAAVVMAHIEHDETLKALEEATENGKGVLVERHLKAGITKIFVTDKVAPGMVHYDTFDQAPAVVEFDAVAFEMGL